MVVQINPPRQQPQQPQRQEESALDKIFKALQIANSGFGIAVNYQQFENVREQRAGRLPAAEQQEITRGQAAASLEKTQAETERASAELEQTKAETAGLPSALEAQTGRTAAVQKTQAETEKLGAQVKKEELETKKLQTEMDLLKNSTKGITDLGKPMNATQLKSQAFLDRSVKAADRMKELSPKISPKLMSKQIKALREAGTIPVIGGASDFLATVLGEDTMNTLPEADKQYLLNAFEVSNLILRDETGAQANPSEIAFRMGQITPAPGDTSKTLQVKAELLNDSLDGMRTNSGKFSQPLTRNENLSFNYETIEKIERGDKKKKAAELRRKIDQRLEGKDVSILDQALNILEAMTVPKKSRQRGLLPPE